MAKECILVVEDEEDIQELIQYNLGREGYRVIGVSDGEAALKATRSQDIDLILLDRMLPGMDGMEICRRLKGDPATRSIPIMMVTAKGEEVDVVTGLELGADDYLTKPFSPRILMARLKAVLRRRQADPTDPSAPVRVHDIEIHPGRHEVSIGGRPVALTFTEFKILHFLAQHPGWVFTRCQIVDAVRGGNYPVTERSVDVQIVGLRKKLGESGRLIETVRGVGYRLKE